MWCRETNSKGDSDPLGVAARVGVPAIGIGAVWIVVVDCRRVVALSPTQVARTMGVRGMEEGTFIHMREGDGRR